MNAEVEDNIRKNVPWGQLPAHIKQVSSLVLLCKAVFTVSLSEKSKYNCEASRRLKLFLILFVAVGKFTEKLQPSRYYVQYKESAAVPGQLG